MEYLKITFDDLDGLGQGLDASNYKQIILDEVKHLESQGVKIVLHDIEMDYVIVESIDKIDKIEQLFKYFSIVTITDCDQFGNVLNTKNEKNSNNEKIKNVKFNIVMEYLKKQNVTGIKPIFAKNHIIFNCPLCQKTVPKMCIGTFTFNITTFSGTDCTDDKHQEMFAKWTKELKKIWDASKEKKNLVYSLNLDYITKIIEKSFPTIIRHKSTGLLFKYDEKLKHYIEMIDNERVSDIETLIYKNFFNDDNKSLTCSQVRDLKKVIIRAYEGFKCVEFESSNLFNLKNGVYDFKLKQLYMHSKDYYFNYCSEITYNPDAKSDVLDKFLKAVITESDPIRIIKTMLGHIHYDGTKLQKGFIFEGTDKGRNGKGTLVKLITSTLGKNRTLTMTLDNFFDSNFYKYELKDKVLYVEDDYKKKYISEKEIGFLNKLIGGADEQVQQKNKPSITIPLKAIPIIQANKRPILKADDDGGFYKRWVFVNFKNEFGDNKIMDEFLGERLLNNVDVMSSMFNYLCEGYEMVIQRKVNNMKGSFFKDDEVSHIDNWRRGNNSAISFFEDCVIKDSDYMCSTRDLYNYYNEYWNHGGGKLPENKFIEILKKEYKLETKRPWLNNKKDRPHCLVGCYMMLDYDNLKSKFPYVKISI